MQKARDLLGPITFEDNAEFGLGMRISADVQHQHAVSLLLSMTDELGSDFVATIIDASQESESEIEAQRRRVFRLKELLEESSHKDAAKNAFTR